MPDAKQPDNQGATIVIHQKVGQESQAAYQQWIEEIDGVLRGQPGFIDRQLIRPVPGLTSTYTIIIRFKDRPTLESWINSDTRKNWLEKVYPLLDHDQEYSIHTGLEFLFQPPNAPAGAPIRWKQFLITWSAIYPLVLTIPLLLLPLLRAMGLPETRFLDLLFVTLAVVFMMIYVVMPRYTKLVRHWLFK